VRVQKDRITGESLLLGPETALKLTESGAGILGLCDGALSLAAIAERLAAEYDAPPDEILADVRDFLERLTEKGFVQWGPA
jgi:pyrroloquinoline quinone biosynthesis protein D